MTERERMLAGKLYNAGDAELLALRRHAKMLLRRLDNAESGQREAILRELFGALGQDCCIEPGLYVDYGCNTYLGDTVYLNCDCVILDVARVEIGDRAAIGPCISQCCFETDADVPTAMLNALGAEAENAIRPVSEKYYVNLKECNAIWLRRAGVTQIDICGACTACQPERFWSHRRVGNDRGSLAAVIMLQGDTT